MYEAGSVGLEPTAASRELIQPSPSGSAFGAASGRVNGENHFLWKRSSSVSKLKSGTGGTTSTNPFAHATFPPTSTLMLRRPGAAFAATVTGTCTRVSAL